MHPSAANSLPDPERSSVAVSLTEEALKTSLARLQQVIDRLPQAIGWMDQAAVFLGCNQAFAQATGFAHPAAIVGQAASAVQWYGQPAAFLHDRPPMEPPQAEYYQLQPLSQTEAPIWLAVTQMPLYDEQGTVEGILSMVEDVTDRKQAEHVLCQSEATNRALINAVPDLLFRIHRDETYLDIQSSKDFKVLNADQLMLGTRVSNSLPPALAQQRTHYVQEALRTGALQIYEQELWLDGAPKYEEVRVAPCQEDEVLVMVRDITDRKQTEKALRLAQFSVEYTSDSVFWLRPDAQIIYANRAACQALGYTAEELQSLTVFDIDPVFPPAAWANHWRQLKQQGSLTLESTHQAKDGRVYPVEMIVSFFALEGEEYNFIRARDITDRKQAEATLRRAQFSIDYAADAIWWIEPDGTIAYINNAGCRDLGYAADAILGRKVWDFDPDVSEAMWVHQWATIQSLGSYTFETRNRHRNGTLYPVEVAVNYIELNGKAYQCAFSRNITNRKQAERDLQLAQFSLEYASDCVLWVRPNAHIAYVNRAACQSLGYTAEELRSLTIFDVDPNFPPSAWSDHWQALQQQGSLTFESTHRTKEGRLYPVEIIVTYFALDGEAYNFARVRDITDRKQAEEALKLTQFSVDRAADPIWWVEPDARIFYINDAGCRDLGYDREAIVGKQIFDFNPDAPVEGWADHWQDLKERGSFTFEARNRNSRGIIYPVEVTVNYIELNGREFNCVLVRNITDRKQAEEALKLTQFSVDWAVDPVWWVEQDGKIFYINDAACRDLGFAREELLGKRVIDIVPGFTEEGWAEHWQQVKAQGSFTFEHSNQTKAGAFYPVEVTVNYIELNGRAFNCALVRNITERKRSEAERKQSEAALRESEQQMRDQAERERLLNRLLSRIRDSLDFDTILETTLQEVQNVTEADRCQFSWYDANNNDSYWEVVKETHYADLPNLIDHYPVSPRSPLLVELQDLQILRVEDAETLPDSSLLRFVNRFGYRAMLAIPMQVRPGLLGTIFCCHSTETRSWSESDIELIQAVMGQLAIALTQADLYNQSRTKAQELEQALRELQKTQTQMVQSEKMSSLGQLVAGVAHEINNPVNFIYGNLTHASHYTQDLLHLVQLYQQHYPNPVPAVQAEADAIDLDFLLDDLPKLLNSMKVGADRIQKIVLSLRNFSRMDEAEVKQVDIHEGIDSTLMILQSRLKGTAGQPEIAIVKDYGQFPPVECYPGQLNQVFMNLLVNAIDALEESGFDRSDRQPTIRIQTERLSQDAIVIRIADNGCGITQAQQQRLFDPFFTTKAVGKGTGLGLSISYQIVVEKHGGSLTCVSAQGEGTEFCIEIPVGKG